ncbi:hypothetical protein AAC387_Pa07g1276 [Persea americana]
MDKGTLKIKFKALTAKNPTDNPHIDSTSPLLQIAKVAERNLSSEEHFLTGVSGAMKRKRGSRRTNKKGKKRKETTAPANDLGRNLVALNTEDNSGLDALNSAIDIDVLSHGHDLPSKVSDMNGGGLNDKPVRRGKGKLRTSKTLETHHTHLNTQTQSDTEKTVSDEHGEFMENMEDAANSLPAKQVSVSEKVSRKPGTRKNKSSKGLGSSSAINVDKHINRPNSPVQISADRNHSLIDKEKAVDSSTSRELHKESSLPDQDHQYNENELSTAMEVIKKIMKMDAAKPFNAPVNPVALGIPDYFNIIETPMDFGTICSDLEHGCKYLNSEEVFRDVQFIWENCSRYNNKGDYILNQMNRVKKNFMKYWMAAGFHCELPKRSNDDSLDQDSGMPEGLPQEDEHGPLKACEKASGSINDASLDQDSGMLESLPQEDEHGPNKAREEASGSITDASLDQDSDMPEGLPQEEEHGPNKACEEASGSINGIPMAEESNGISVNAGTSSSLKQKPVITLNAFGLPVGDYSAKLATRCGKLVRTHVPISIKDWRAVPKSMKDELWKLLQDEFVVPQSYKNKCLKSMSEMFRKYKTTLRMRYLDPHTTQEDRLSNCPPIVRPEDWEAFIDHNSNPKTIEQRKKNAEVRKNLDIYHTSGRHGHARLEEKMKRQRKEDDPPLTRAEVWIQAHIRKDGSVPSSVSSHIERVKELLSSQDEVNSHDILNDPLTQVFGVDTRGRVRGVGNVSRTQILGSSTTLEKLAVEERKVIEQSTSIKNLESRVDYLIEEIGGIKQLIIEQRVASGSQASASVPLKMPKSVAVSNIIGIDRPSMILRPCKLLSWRKEVVAHGTAYIGNEPQQICCKSVPEDMYKIMIDVIEKGDVELPNPDGYHSTLGEVGNGSFVAWPMSFITFTD